MIRTRSLVLVLGLLLGAAACGASGGEATTESTTSAAGAADGATTSTDSPDSTDSTETTDTTEGTEPDSTDTTEGSGSEDGPAGPVGDEKLIPLLLEPSDFGPGLVATDATDDEPEPEFCDGVAFETEWQASATMSADADSEETFAGVSQSILEFAPGDAAKFIDEFSVVTEECKKTGDGEGLDVVPLAGVGDEALHSAPGAAPDSFPIEFAVIRTGDNVLVMFGISDGDPYLTDALLKQAVAKVKAG